MRYIWIEGKEVREASNEKFLEIHNWLSKVKTEVTWLLQYLKLEAGSLEPELDILKLLAIYLLRIDSIILLMRRKVRLTNSYTVIFLPWFGIFYPYLNLALISLKEENNLSPDDIESTLYNANYYC